MNARSTPAPSSQAIRSARCARSRTIRAERWGTARKPSAWSCSQSATVASTPFAGETVTDTVEPGGRKAAWSSAFLSGTSSKVGVRRTAARAAARDEVSDDRRRNSIQASDFRIGHRRLATGDELEQRLVDRGVDRRRLEVGQHPLPDRVRALRGVERAVLLPLFEAVVVGD